MIAPPTTAAPTPYPQPGPRQPPPLQPGPRHPGPPRQPPPPPQPRPPQPTVSTWLGAAFASASAPESGAADAALVNEARLAAGCSPLFRPRRTGPACAESSATLWRKVTGLMTFARDDVCAE